MSSKKRAKTERNMSTEISGAPFGKRAERKFSAEMLTPSKSTLGMIKGDPVIADIANSIVIPGVMMILCVCLCAYNFVTSTKTYALVLALLFGVLYPLMTHDAYHYQKTWFGFPTYKEFQKGEDGLISNFIRYSIMHTMTFVSLLASAHKYISPTTAFVSTTFHILAITENSKPDVNKTSSAFDSLVSKILILIDVALHVPDAQQFGTSTLITLLFMGLVAAKVMSNHLAKYLLLMELAKMILLTNSAFSGWVLDMSKMQPFISVAYLIALVFSSYIYEIGTVVLGSNPKPSLPKTALGAILSALVYVFPILSLFFYNGYLTALVCFLTFSSTIECSNFNIQKGTSLLGNAAMSFATNYMMKK